MATTDRADPKKPREWYSASLTTVAFFGFLVVAIIGVLVFPHLDRNSIESQAERAIFEATERIELVEQRDDIDQIKVDQRSAWDLLAQANAAFDESDFERALESGERCLLALDAIESKGQGTIRVLSVQGGVEYRRGERGAWKRLRNHVSLNQGDWVKTQSDGTAELLFSGDGSLFTLRQSTMVHLGGETGGLGNDKATNVSFGSVELATSASDHMVTTPKAQAKVGRDSAALVAFDRDRGAGRFAAFSGGVEVTAKDTGEKVQISNLQQVDLVGGRWSAVKNLPGQPALDGPGDDHAIDLASETEIRLKWKAVNNARRYALHVSSNRLFASHYIDNKRSKTSARVRVRREGQYYWRVAAVNADNDLGPWSESRSFRATAANRIAQQVSDKEPPPLEVSKETYGNIIIISGKTELGATVTIDKDAVALRSDGTFRQSIEVSQAGLNVLEVVSTDAWGNATTEKVRIFIDAL